MLKSTLHSPALFSTDVDLQFIVDLIDGESFQMIYSLSQNTSLSVV